MQLLEMLRDLIQGLESAEKRNLRSFLTAKTKQGGQLSELYELLLAAPPEQVGSEYFSASHPEIGNNLPTLTRRLMEVVNSSLELQNRGKTIESRLNHALETIAILYRKKQWDLANWKLRKEKAMALRFGYFPQFLSLLKWERTILLERFPNKKIDQLRRIRDEEKQVQTKLALQTELSHLNHLMRYYVQQHRELGTSPRNSQLINIITNPIVDLGLDSSEFLSFSYATNIKGIYLNATKDYGKAAEIYRPAFSRWQENPAWVREQSQFFLAIFSNYQIALLYGQDDTKELEECLLFVRQVRLSDLATQLIFQNISYQSGILLYMNLGDFEAGILLYQEIANWLDQNARDLSGSTHLTFRYNAVAIFLVTEDFPGMQRVLNEIMDFSGKSARQDITDLARILLVIAWIEMGDLEFCEYHLRNAYQYFLRNRYTELYRLTIELLRNLLRPEKDRNDLFAKYLQDLDDLVAKTDKSDFGMMELRIWARARLRGIDLRTVFSEFISG